MVLALAVWVGAIAALVTANVTDKFLWLPVLLALAGVFSSILPLAIPSNVAAAVNGAFFVLFIASLAAVRPKHRVKFTFITHRVR